jgi:hypothetical protein
MKNSILLLVLFSLVISCKPENKENIKAVKKPEAVKIETVKNINKDYTIAPVNFLEEKYKRNAYKLSEDSPSFPFYSFFDENLGEFTVNYIGKSELTRDYWNNSNSEGFFSKFGDIDLDSVDLKEEVNKVLKHNLDQYYILTVFVPNENDYTYFYIFENNQWILIQKKLTNKITKQGINLYNDLLLSYKLKDLKPISEKFYGKFTADVDGEYTNDGVGHTTYYFTITKNKIDLKSEEFRGDFVCEGEYKGIEDNNILELYYDRDDERCLKLKPTYLIKKEDDNYFIKGIGGEGSINEWIKMDVKTE